MRVFPCLRLSLCALSLLVFSGCADPIAVGGGGAGGGPGSGGNGIPVDGGMGGAGGSGAMGGGDGGMVDCTVAGCDDGNECTIDGVCNTLTRECQDGGGFEPVDTPCMQAGGFFCDGEGSCVACTQDSQCARFFPPQECREAAACVDNECPFPDALLDGTPCSEGECFQGDCVSAAPQTKLIPMGCDNSNTPGLWDMPMELTVTPTAVEATREFSADLEARLFITREFLQFALDAVFPEELTTLEVQTGQAEIATGGVFEGSPVSTQLFSSPLTIAIPQAPNPSDPQGPKIATDDVTIPLVPIFNSPYRAEVSGTVCYDAGGEDPPSTIGAPPVRTGIRAVASNGAAVRFECIGGTVNDNGTPSNPFDDFIDPNEPETTVCFPIAQPDVDLCEGPPPVDCSLDEQCLSGAVCDPFSGECALGSDEPRGTACDEDGGRVCDGQGACVQCVEDSGCGDDRNECTSDPTCENDACLPSTNLPQGTVCNQDGGNRCDGNGNCVFVGDGPFPQSQPLALGCATNLTADVAIVPFELAVAPGAITAGQPFVADVSGAAELSEELLDAVQWVIIGGVSRVDVIELAATVHVRAGATGEDVTLRSESIPFRCAVDDAACDPDNDEPGVPGKRGNADCVPVGPANPCGRFLDLPTSDDCGLGGVCAVLDGGSGTKLDQCSTNGFCVTGPMLLPLQSQVGSYVADDSPSPGPIYFGWDDASTGATLNPDGTWNLPPAVFTNPITSNGIRAGLDALSVALECTMGVDSGGPSGVGVPDQASPTPDASLISFPIQSR